MSYLKNARRYAFGTDACGGCPEFYLCKPVPTTDGPSYECVRMTDQELWDNGYPGHRNLGHTGRRPLNPFQRRKGLRRMARPVRTQSPPPSPTPPADLLHCVEQYVQEHGMSVTQAYAQCRKDLKMPAPTPSSRRTARRTQFGASPCGTCPPGKKCVTKKHPITGAVWYDCVAPPIVKPDDGLGLKNPFGDRSAPQGPPGFRQPLNPLQRKMQRNTFKAKRNRR